MRISDWSSDVCSSDLALGGDAFELVARIPHQPAIGVADRERARAISVERVVDQPAVGAELRRSIGILLVAHGPGPGQAAQLFVVPAVARIRGGGAAIDEHGGTATAPGGQRAPLRGEGVAGAGRKGGAWGQGVTVGVKL